MFCALFYESNANSSTLIYILKNMGYLPIYFDYDVFAGLVNHKNEDVRYWAVKNLGKSKSDKYYDLLVHHLSIEDSTIVKREIVSSGSFSSKEPKNSEQKFFARWSLSLRNMPFFVTYSMVSLVSLRVYLTSPS